MEFLKPFAEYYYLIYWLIVMLMTISQFILMKQTKGYAIVAKRYGYDTIVAFTFFFIIFYGFRPISYVFGDTVIYNAGYELLRNYGVFNLQGSKELPLDMLFAAFEKLCAQIIDIHVWFAIIMSFYMLMMLLGCRKLDYKHGAILMLFCIGAFEFYTYSVNGIRNGVACSFVIMAVACLCKNEKIYAILFSIIAIGCHKSTALPVATMFFSYFIMKPKYMFLTWFGAILLSLFIGGYIENLLSLFNFDERLANNLQRNEADGVIIERYFRWDFLLYSSMPILLGYYAIFKRKLYNSTYLILLGTYIYANSFWVLIIRAMFSNRIAYLSWFIYPIVLAYPLLNFPIFKKHHNEKTAWILLGHFGFTTILWLLGK